MSRALAIAAAILGAGAAGVDIRTGIDPRQLGAEIEAERDHISALDLAERIRGDDPTLQILDLRSSDEFKEFHIPGAHQISIVALAHQSFPHDRNIVLYSEGGAHAAQAWVLLRMRGFRKVVILREGIYEWISRVFEPRLAVDATSSERTEFQRAAALSRFFGGTPLEGVDRAQVPIGYWTNGPSAGDASASPTKVSIARIRRRGC